jgi:ABC-type phosphate transport system substrate-binding protein
MNLARSTSCLILLAVLCSSIEAGSQVSPAVKTSEDIAVVVNAKNTSDNLSLEDLRKILLGERRFWQGSVQVSLVLREPGTRERDHVLAVLLKMSNADFERHWQAKIFRGEVSTAPLAVPSNGMASQFVYDTPGGITFVAGKNLRADSKVLKIDGKLPGEKGYSLR